MPKISRIKLLITGLALCLAVRQIPLRGQAPARFSVPIERFKLKNGLDIVLTEDDTLPVVSVAIAYRVGSVNDPPDKSGLAYLLEDLMFQGSLNVSPMQHISYISRAGGETNASTTQDVTLFYETLPSNQLALALWLESDRMNSLEITPATVQRSKESLLEEIRQRLDGEPYLESFLIFDEMVYPDYAHQHPIMGYENDIRGLTVEDAREFYAAHYVPNNAVLVISGRFDEAWAREVCEKYFDSIPPAKNLAAPPLPDAMEKYQMVRDFSSSRIPTQAFHLAYRIAPPDSDDFPALTLIDCILLHGKSSRLQKRLLQKDYRLVSQLSGGIEKRSRSAVLKLFALTTNANLAAESQRAIQSELNRFRTSFISNEELDKAKNFFRMDYIQRFSTTLDRAVTLAEAFFTHPRFDEIFLDLDRVLLVSPEEVSRMVQRYFVPRNMVLLNMNKVQ